MCFVDRIVADVGCLLLVALANSPVKRLVIALNNRMPKNDLSVENPALV